MTADETTSAFRTLNRLMREREPEERCDLCAAGIGADHRHLVEVATGSLRCSCRACALLFGDGGAHAGRFRVVPEHVRLLTGFRLTDDQWDAMLVPVGMAFFHRSSRAGRIVAQYPGPAGATGASLAPEAWRALEAANPVLAELEPDVEALLVNRVGRARDHLMVPIDECFRLVGLIRSSWRGLSGGTEAWRAIADFFEELRARAVVVDG